MSADEKTKDGDGTVDHARAWLRNHADDPSIAGASLPQDHRRDPETGETIEREQSSWLTAGRFDTFLTGALRATEGHRGVLSYSHIHPDQLDVGEPIVGRGGRDLRELDVRVRMDRALAQLEEDQRELLRMRFYEDLTLEDIADALGVVTRSAIHKRLQTALQDLYLAIATTWALPYDLTFELFGQRPRGRPGRDREGERRAAEMTFLAYRQLYLDEEEAP